MYQVLGVHCLLVSIILIRWVGWAFENCLTNRMCIISCVLVRDQFCEEMYLEDTGPDIEPHHSPIGQ